MLSILMYVHENENDGRSAILMKLYGEWFGENVVILSWVDRVQRNGNAIAEELSRGRGVSRVRGVSRGRVWAGDEVSIGRWAE